MGIVFDDTDFQKEAALALAKLQNAIRKVCGAVPDAFKAGVGGDYGLGATASGQIGVVANGRSGELSLVVSPGTSAGFVANDAYVFGAAMWNVPSADSMNTSQHPSLSDVISGAAGVGRSTVGGGKNNLQVTSGPSMLPATAAVSGLGTRVLVSAPWLGYAFDLPTSACTASKKLGAF